MGHEKEFFKQHFQNDPKSSTHQLLLASLNARDYTAFQSFLNRGLKELPHSFIFDYIYPPLYEKTILEIACCKGLKEFVSLLLVHLEKSEDINKINEKFDRGLLHFTVEEGHSAVLQALLQHESINPNLEVGGMQTALHMAVKNEDLKCIELLVNAEARPDIPNAKGETAFHYAASSKKKEIIDLVINGNYAVPLDIDTFKNYKKQTVRDILKNNFPEIEKKMPEQARRVDFNLLKYFLVKNDEKNFLKNLAESDPKEPMQVPQLIMLAAGNNLLNAVLELISKLEKMEKVDLLKAAELAMQRGHYKVFKEILKYDFNLSQKLIIRACEELATPIRSGIDHRSIRLQFLKLILALKNIDVTVEDDKGNTPLHYAVRAENDEAVEELLRAGSYIGHMNRVGVPPLALIRSSILETFFDKHIQSSKEHTENFELHYNYNCLLPPTSRHCRTENYSKTRKRNLSKEVTEIAALNYIAHNNALKHLLKHPLPSSLLYIKWSRIRHIFYANLGSYILFFFTLVAFIIISNWKSEDEQGDKFRAGEQITRICVFIQLAILVLRKLCQFFSSQLHYITSLENWFQVLLIIMVGVFLLTTNAQIGAVVILFSAWELVELIGQHPSMSIQIEIFKKILANFTLFLLLYAFLIFAFALAFYILFRGTEKFPNVHMSIFKTILMLVGEFDASDMPFEMDPILGRIIFLAFILVIAIVLFNMLTGIAVSDTQNMQSNSEIVTLVARTKNIFHFEEIAVSFSVFLENCCCSFLQPIVQNPKLNFVRRVFIYPAYLPEKKLSEKPYKNHEILIQGRIMKPSLLNTLKMDSSISDGAKEIVWQRGRVSDEEIIPMQLETLDLRLQKTL
ncbi:transient receptor potential cation channel protein painless-like isoform X2 [Belonocnema kinseyi]|uniref:transient receptor potential cation channel protein painless-like isoform X2 n=1 Tax=Belonocnema kinseyi TaxID=2817044 RepID=UPI00143DA4F2|nr:transient receptor potential cation channel protein painless-like isoform X2 [Belonocnema kinseyi]